MSSADHQNYTNARMGLFAASEARDAACDAARYQATITQMAAGRVSYEYMDSEAYAAAVAAEEAYQRAFVVYTSAKLAFERAVKLRKEVKRIALLEKKKNSPFERYIRSVQDWTVKRRKNRGVE
uniref:Uncharacterized protein n=1 Tax=viral metagenome TaxID=1070528 RepID=A0A6C0JW19_9ZZZZ